MIVSRKALLLSLLVLAGCGEKATEPEGSVVAVFLDSSTIQANGSTNASLIIVQTDGARPITGTAVWKSSNTSVATVTPIGTQSAKVTAVGSGSVAISATIGGIPASEAPLTVVPVPVLTSMQLVISTPSIKKAGLAFTTITAKDQAGASISTGTLTWSSSAPSVATVSQSGTITGVDGGQAVIKATAANGVSAEATVTVAFPAAKLLFVSQPPATVQNRVPIAPTVTVQVADVNGNPVVGNEIITVTLGGGGALAGTSSVVTTNANGLATLANLQVNGATGPKTLTAAAFGLTSAIASFSLTPGPAAFVQINGGNAQTAISGTNVPIMPSVRVTDADANGVPGASILFAIGAGGGSVTGANQTTGPSGVATVGSWTLGTAGANTLTATVFGTTLTFTATASGLSPACGSFAQLPLDTPRPGTLVASGCTLINPFSKSASKLPFNGPESGGVYFYDLYNVDVAAGGIARVTVTAQTLLTSIVFVFDQSGAYVTDAFGSSAATINNTTGATKRYQVLVVSPSSGSTGSYSVVAAKLL